MDYTSLLSANCLIRGLFLLGTKSKQSQALPLKEDFRQVPAHITGQVFQTTWSQRVIARLSNQQASKASSKELKATYVPEKNLTQSVYKSNNQTDNQSHNQTDKQAMCKA
jgi:hypothetical protein